MNRPTDITTNQGILDFCRAGAARAASVPFPTVLVVIAKHPEYQHVLNLVRDTDIAVRLRRISNPYNLQFTKCQDAVGILVASERIITPEGEQQMGISLGNVIRALEITDVQSLVKTFACEREPEPETAKGG